MAIFLIAVGLLLTGIDFFANTGVYYPDYIQQEDVYHGIDMQAKIQEYVNQNILGGQFRIDVLPDVIGCILIVIGVCMLLKHSKKYIQCIVLAVLTGVVSVLVRVIPFYANGGDRVVAVLLLFSLHYLLEIWMEYSVVNLTVKVSDDVVNVATNRRMLFGWWVTVFARIFIFLLTFSGVYTVRHVYEVVTVGFTLFYLYQFLETRKYVGKYKVYKEGFNSAILPDYVRKKIESIPGRDVSEVPYDDLRFVRILHYDFEGQVKDGEMIVNQKIAYATMRAFYQLYKWEYPIESVHLLEDYEGDEDECREANNTYAYTYKVFDRRSEDTASADGMAININPMINPCTKNGVCDPVNATAYMERDPKKCTGGHSDKMIHKKDMAYKIFRRNGFHWCGDKGDYMRFK